MQYSFLYLQHNYFFKNGKSNKEISIIKTFWKCRYISWIKSVTYVTENINKKRYHYKSKFKYRLKII